MVSLDINFKTIDMTKNLLTQENLFYTLKRFAHAYCCFSQKPNPLNPQ